MSLFDSKLFAWLKPRRQPIFHSRALPGRRISLDRPDELSAGWMAIEAPPDHESNWRTLSLDNKTLSLMSPADLVELMVDLSPEISSGLWHYLRLCNPGWEVKAYQVGSEDDQQTINQQAQTVLEEFLQSLHFIYTPENEVPADTVLNVLFITAWLRGAFAAELVLDEDGRTPLNIATPDPHGFRFRKVNDEIRGQLWQLGQYQDGLFKPIDRETVRYIPVDPLPGKPYGRSLMAPSLFTCLFLLSMLHDIKRVVMQQGYPRLDLSVNFELLASNAPPEARPGTEEFDTWVTAVMNEIDTVYSSLEPDDAYVHSDVIAVNRPVGAVDASALGGIGDLITVLERMASRALKIQPLLLGINDTTTETNAIRQWEIQSATIKSLQHLAENLLQGLLQLALEAQGIQATVEFRFAELRDSELMRDAQTEAIRIQNAKAKYLAGWINQDQASEEITDHPADVPLPRVIDLGGTADIFNADTANNELIQEIQRARLAIEASFPQVPVNGHAH